MVAREFHRLLRSAVVRLLRAERLKQRLSYERLAERAGISYQIISYMERELRSPTLDTVLRIAVALKVPLSKVLSEAEATVAKPGKKRSSGK